MRIGVIGTGFAGAMHARSAQGLDDVRVTAIATGFGGRVRRRRAEAPVAAAAPSPTPVFSAPSVTDVEIDIPSFLKEE